MLPQTNASHGNDFRRLILRILSRDGKTLSEEGGSEGRGGGRKDDANSRNFIYTSIHKKTPNHKTTKKKHIRKQHSKQAKTGEVERNYKKFANMVFINSSGFALRGLRNRTLLSFNST